MRGKHAHMLGQSRRRRRAGAHAGCRGAEYSARMPRIPAVQAPALFRQQLLAAIPRLRRYARSLVFETPAADDLVQTTLERALTYWHQFDQRRDIVVWLVGIAHHAYVDDRRRQGRLRVVEPEEAAAAADALRHEPASDVALRMDLVAALERLPAEQREPLLLVSVEQFTYAECAEALGIPIGTVMSRISRARVALRALLDGRAAVLASSATSGLRRVS